MKQGRAGGSRWPQGVEWGAAVLLSLLALWMHAARVVFAGGLWRDETAALRLATLPSLGEVWRLFPHEAFPMVVPIGLRLFVAACGQGDHVLRLLGSGVGLAIVAALWVSAHTSARTPPLAGLALLVPNAAFVVFGDELRGYGLGSLFIVLSFAALARLLDRPSPWAAAAALVAVLGSVHTLLANTALVGALCGAAILTALLYGRRRLAWAVFAIGFAAAVSLLPYAAPLAGARSWDVVVVYPEQIVHLAAVLGASTGPGPARAIWLTFGMVGAGGVLWLLLRRRMLALRAAQATPPAVTPAWRPAAGDALQIFGALTAVFALAAQLLFLKVLSYSPRAWYYLPLMALGAAALEPAIAGCCRSAGLRGVRAGICLVCAALLLPGALPRLPTRMTNMDLVAQRIAALAAPDDLVVVSPWYNGISFSRYYPRQPAPPASQVALAEPGEAANVARQAGLGLGGRQVPAWITLPEIPDYRIHRYDLLIPRLAAQHPIDDVLDSVRRCLAGGHRVWLVGDLWLPAPGTSMDPLPPAPGGAPGWHDFPYIKLWIFQLGRYLEAHAASFRMVEVPAPSLVSPLEAGVLMEVSGWHETPATPSAPVTPSVPAPALPAAGVVSGF